LPNQAGSTANILPAPNVVGRGGVDPLNFTSPKQFGEYFRDIDYTVNHTNHLALELWHTLKLKLLRKLGWQLFKL